MKNTTDQFEKGSYVYHARTGDAIWQITELGELSFYSSGAPLGEDSSTLRLRYPPRGESWGVLYKQLWALREDLTLVPEMVVLARAAERPLSTAKAFLSETPSARKKRRRREQRRI